VWPSTGLQLKCADDVLRHCNKTPEGLVKVFEVDGPKESAVKAFTINTTLEKEKLNNTLNTAFCDCLFKRMWEVVFPNRGFNGT